MKRCPSCGTDNLDRSRFCEQCGTKLPDLVAAAAPTAAPASDPDAEARGRAEQRERAAAGLPPSFMPPPVQPSFAPESGWGHLDDAEEPPKKKKRRLFLWIIGAFLLVCILICVGSSIFFGYTDTGKRIYSDFETRAAELATEQATSDAIATTAP